MNIPWVSEWLLVLKNALFTQLEKLPFANQVLDLQNKKFSHKDLTSIQLYKAAI